MKIRRDAVALSSILFTVALLMLMRPMIDWARVTHQTRLRDITTAAEGTALADQVVIPNYSAPIGIASLALTAIALIVTWAGYIKGVRWTWFVMFVITWVWAFPLLMLPYLRPWRGVGTMAQSFAGAISESLHAGFYSGLARTFLEVTLVFLLMVVALILPAKAFILGRAGGHPSEARAGSERP